MRFQMKGPWEELNDIPIVQVEWLPQVEAHGIWCAKCCLPSAVSVSMYAMTKNGMFSNPVMAEFCTSCADSFDMT